MDFNTPPHRQNYKGQPRKAGFEFELAGIEIKDCAELLAELFDGEVSYKQSLVAEISDTAMGTFKVELDAQMIKNMAYKLEQKQPTHKDDMLNINELRRSLSEWIGVAAQQLVPFEIVTPPFEFEQFPKLEILRQKLQQKKAQGTKSNFVNAFGMHINPDIPSEKVESIRDIVRAFLILYPWLKEVMDIDTSRRILTYIDPFPKDYVTLVLGEDYNTSIEQFIHDYLKHNPTRNRALDLLPLFAHLKPDSLNDLKESDRKLVKARPTFHYRLPNCEIDDPNWRIAQDWNYWVEVEKLAEDKEKLHSMAKDYQKFLGETLHFLSRDWLEQTSKKYGYAA